MLRSIVIRKVKHRWVVSWQDSRIIAKRFFLQNAVARAKRKVRNLERGKITSIVVYDNDLPTQIWSFETDGFPPL